MSEAIVPDSEHRGLVARLPQRCATFALLARFDRPIGWWLLFWPCAWGRVVDRIGRAMAARAVAAARRDRHARSRLRV
jgi:hypothetical protein